VNDNNREILEQRYRFFAEKAAQLAFEQDKILVTLFTGIVAGLLALLVSKQVGFWSGLCFLIADLSAVVGLGTCLLHMAFSAKVMGLLAAMFGGEEKVPNLVAREEPTEHALNKNRLFAQMCYAGQLMCLFWSVTFAGLGVLALVWDTVGWLGLGIGLVFPAGLVGAVFRPLVQIHRLARIALQEKGKVHDGGTK
jgi:hypothetical protein